MRLGVFSFAPVACTTGYHSTDFLARCHEAYIVIYCIVYGQAANMWRSSREAQPRILSLLSSRHLCIEHRHPDRQISLMEFLGVSLAVVSLVLQIAELYEKIKNHSIEFHRLDQDLKCFYDALVLAKHYLHHQALHRTRIACQDIAYDVKTLLWKRQRQVSWARSIFKVSSSEIQQLRDRMHFQLTNLHHSAR